MTLKNIDDTDPLVILKSFPVFNFPISLHRKS